MSPKATAALAVLLLNAACSTQPAAPPTPVVVESVALPPQPQPVARPSEPVIDPVQRTVAHFERARRFTAVEFAREIEAARVAYARVPEEAERLRLAVLLAVPNTAFNDDTRALELLDPFVRSVNHPVHALAVVLASYLQEQRRLANAAQAMQKEVQALQQKLDALRTLERALSEREGAAQRRR